jgi:general secretion pathway protein K
MSSKSLKNQRGIALLMAMLVVAIATVTAVSLVHEQSFSVRKTSNLQHYDIGLLYGLGLEDYARLFLNKDARESKIDSLEEDWAIGIPALPIEGGFLSGAMADGQSLININNLLTNEFTRKQLKRLCADLEVNADFIPAVIDWIDANTEPEVSDGAEDDYYTALEIPYRSANRLMADISELKLVKGVDNEMYYKLKPFLIALPEDTALNLNTISAQMYETLELGKTGQEFIDEREKDAFKSVDDFATRMDIVLDENQKKNLSVSTSYFVANGVVTFDEKTVALNSLIKRDDQGLSHVLYRSLGGML